MRQRPESTAVDKVNWQSTKSPASRRQTLPLPLPPPSPPPSPPPTPTPSTPLTFSLESTAKVLLPHGLSFLLGSVWLLSNSFASNSVYDLIWFDLIWFDLIWFDLIFFSSFPLKFPINCPFDSIRFEQIDNSVFQNRSFGNRIDQFSSNWLEELTFFDIDTFKRTLISSSLTQRNATNWSFQTGKDGGRQPSKTTVDDLNMNLNTFGFDLSDPINCGLIDGSDFLTSLELPLEFGAVDWNNSSNINNAL